MQTETDNSHNSIRQELRNLPGMSPSEILTGMPECTFDTGYFVPFKSANSIKSLMTQLKNETKMLFSSKVVEDGIIVWKVTNNNLTE